MTTEKTFDLYAVSTDIDPRNYEEEVIEESISYSALESRMGWWRNVMPKGYVVVSEVSS